MIGGMMLQVATAVPNSPWGLVLGSTAVTKGVVILLAALSLFSWTVMFAKWAEFASVRRRSAKFLAKFEHVEHFSQALSIAARENPNPYTRVIRRASEFLAQGDICHTAGAPRGSGGVAAV